MAHTPAKIAEFTHYLIDYAGQIASIDVARPSLGGPLFSSKRDLRADHLRGGGHRRHHARLDQPHETLGAHQLKAQFGGNRLKKRQDAVQKWIRDNMRIKAELMAEHFEPEVAP